MASNRRQSVRRTIGYPAKIIAGDGSWGRDCRVMDVSESGAKLRTAEPVELPANFILAFAARGSARRRCRVVWTVKNEIGVRFEGREES